MMSNSSDNSRNTRSSSSGGNRLHFSRCSPTSSPTDDPVVVTDDNNCDTSGSLSPTTATGTQTATELDNINNSTNTTAISTITNIRLDECIHYLDRRLLALSWYELRELFIHIHHIAESGQIIRDLMAEYRVNGINITTPQQQKLNKIHDYVMENIVVVSIHHPVYSEQQLQHWSIPNNLVIASYLPNHSYLMHYQYKMKLKLKSLEEMLLSKKLDACKFRFSGKMTLLSRLQNQKIFDLSLLKREVIRLDYLLDELSFYFDQYHDLFHYFEAVKEYVHKPWQHIILQANTLPNLEELQAKLQSESETFKSLEEQYNQARSNEQLVSVAILKSQLSQIEELITATAMNGLPVAQIVQSLEKISLSGNETERKLTQDQEKIILQLLGGRKGNVTEVLRQRSTTQIEETFRVYAMCLISTFNYQPKKQGQSGDDENSNKSSEVSWMDKFECFDWGHYFGIIQLWQEKQQFLECMMQDQAFIDAYQSLQTARHGYRRSGKTFEKSLKEFYGNLKKHDAVFSLVQEFKLRVNKIAEKELCQNVSIL